MTELTKKAEKLATELYKRKERLNGESYLNHAKKVADRLKGIGIRNENVLAAAMLHDVNKDVDIENTLKIIKKKMPTEVYEILESYVKTSNSMVLHESATEGNTRLVIQAFLGLAKNLDVLLIVLADKLENSRSLHMLEPDKRIRSAKRALNIYAPLCRFVGLQPFAVEIEKNSFRVLFPGEYSKIRNILTEISSFSNVYLKEISEMIKKYLDDNRIHSTVSYRIKSEYSIYKKYKLHSEKDDSYDYSSVADIAALRILVNTVDECYKVEDLLKEVWDEDYKHRDDYIENKKQSGYQSLHCYFYIEKDYPLEIQIRTYDMHEQNEYGKSSHLFYKMGDIFKKHGVKESFWLKEIKFGNDYQDQNINLFKDYVYVFTPKGDIIELPKGSSVLDFAYAIHDDIGNKCAGALVNDEMKKLTQIVENGDRVLIKTGNKVNVSRDWLTSVKTPRARSNIRKALRAQISKAR